MQTESIYSRDRHVGVYTKNLIGIVRVAVDLSEGVTGANIESSLLIVADVFIIVIGFHALLSLSV
jgi:hypothetical protein